MVDENMPAGTPVGTASRQRTRMRGHADVLRTTKDCFDVDDMGYITTTMMLDHETMASHMVTITATDSDGATDARSWLRSCVTNVDETPMPSSDDAATEFSVEENMPVGTVVGTVQPTKTMTRGRYSDDSVYFDVDNMGQITTAMMLMTTSLARRATF